MLKWALVAVGVLVLLAVLALAALPLLLDTPAIQAYVSQAAAQALGRPVRFTSLSVSAFPLPTVRLRGIEVAEDPAFGRGPFLTVAEGRIGMRVAPLLLGRVELADLTLAEPRIELREDAAGRWNLASLGGAAAGGAGAPRGGGKVGGAAAGAVLVSRVHIVNGALRYHKSGAKPADLRLERVNVTMSQPGPGDGLRLGGEAVAQPGGVRLRIAEAALTPGSARSFGDMPVRATVEVEAQDVGPLGAAVLASPGLTGPLKGRVQLTGTPGRLAATGEFRFDRLTLSAPQPQCAEPKRRRILLEDVLVPLAYTPAQVESRKLQAKVARGSVSARLLLALGPGAPVTLKEISVSGMELGPVLVDYLCQRYAVTGPLDLTGDATLQAADPWRTLNGSGRLAIGRGKVVGAELLGLVDQVLALADVVSSALRPDRRARAKDSPLDFDSITATYTVTNGVVRTDDLLYRAQQLRVEAAGTYGLADGRVAMDVTLTQGANQVKGRVSGAAGSLRVVPTGVKLQEPRSLKKLLEKIVR